MGFILATPTESSDEKDPSLPLTVLLQVSLQVLHVTLSAREYHHGFNYRFLLCGCCYSLSKQAVAANKKWFNVI